MIVMAVAQDDGINFAEICAEFFSVVYQRVSLSCIKQQFVFFSFDVNTQTVFGCKTFIFSYF